ncbi:Flp pilus assembly protein CpaB [Solirhodobacter olei]|uniref:Flp pilus assembly protein CpaB n=1 Tax=Solirhodobacter olei TaxID=2493082 RepID=UPI0013E2B59C|nr:Flp pilus assembly protein CpaB [Solirhodobacter olei]
MTIRTIGVLALSGIGAAGVAWVYVRSGPAPVPASAAESVAVSPAQTVSVLVAARGLKPGDVVRAADIASARRPKAGVPPDAIPSDAVHFGGITGRVVRYPLAQGAIFDPHDLQAAPSVDAALLARGMRGISIAVTPQSAVAGLLTRGDYVDVLLAYKTSSGQEASRRILQGLRVLATDQDTAVTGMQFRT